MSQRIDNIVNTLRSDETKTMFVEMLRCLETLTQDEIVEVHKYYDDKIQNIASSLIDLCMDGDDSEAYAMLPSLWLELRLEWNRYNNQMQYQTFSLGEAKPALMAKGSCLSFILGVVEAFINSEDLFWIYKIATQPVDSVRERTKLATRFYELVESFDKCSQLTIETLFQTRDDLVQKESHLGKKLDSSILKIAEIYTQSVWLNVRDLNENLLLQLAPWLRLSNTRAVLNVSSPDDNIRIAPEVATAFRSIAQCWMKSIFNSRVATAPECHDVNVPHINLSWSVQKVKGRLKFTFLDDSQTTDPVVIDVKKFAHLGLIVDTKREDVSRELTFSCDHRSLHEYLVVSQQKDGKSQLFGISTNYVVRVERSLPVIELDSTRKLASLESSKNLPLVSLRQQIGLGDVDQAINPSYVVIDNIGTGGFVMEVDQVVGIVRGSLKPGVGMKESKSCLGVVIGGESLINIIDIFSFRGAA